MKSRRMTYGRTILLTAFLLMTLGLMFAAIVFAQSSVVVPNAFASTEGPLNNCFPFCSSPTRYQQLYAASGIGGSGIIDKIAFRLDGIVAGAGFSNQPVDLEVRLSHVTFGPDDAGFTNTYANNVGPDETLVLDAVVPLSGSVSLIKPNPFDIILDVDNTFTYNGTDNLLMEIRIFSTQPTNGFTIFAFDATGFTIGDSVSRLSISGGAGNALAPNGSRNTLGLVTQFNFAAPPIIPVDIDIKPGSDSSSINCNNENGVIPVAILTTADFDATTADHTTVTFEGASETHVDKKSGGPRRHEEDVDSDGDTDLVLHFRLGETDLTCSSTGGILIGETFDGQPIEGTDAVRMVGG